MEIKELTNFKESYKQFEKDCNRVLNYLSKLEPSGKDKYVFKPDYCCLDDDSVWCYKYSEYVNDENMECDFDVILLTYTEEELQKYVDELNRKYKEKEKTKSEQSDAKEFEESKRLMKSIIERYKGYDDKISVLKQIIEDK